MQAAIDALANPPHLKGMQAAIDALANPPHLKGMQAAIDALANPPHLRGMQAAIDALANPPHLKGMQAAIDALANSPHLKGMQAAIDALTNPPHLAQLASVLSVSGMGATLFAAVSSYQELVAGSTLASFLVSPNAAGKPPARVVEVEGHDSAELGDFALLETEYSSVDDEVIVKAITEGKTAQLSSPALMRIRFVYLQLVAVWDMILRIVQTYMAYLFLSTLLNDVSAPADIKHHVAQLPSHERVLLVDYRIVNRDGARLRAEATTASEVLVTLKIGTLVEVLEKSDKGWFHVAVEHQEEWIEGWVHLTVTTPVSPSRQSRKLVADVETNLKFQ